MNPASGGERFNGFLVGITIPLFSNMAWRYENVFVPAWEDLRGSAVSGARPGDRDYSTPADTPACQDLTCWGCPSRAGRSDRRR